MKMRDYVENIAALVPHDEKEAADQSLMLWYIRHFGNEVLTRQNRAAHITSAGFIMNPALEKTLMIHHNIRDTWAWTGGHADGDSDMVAVAVREAMEETGVTSIAPLSPAIASLDVLTVEGHVKRGEYVSAHLHLSVAYILLCDETESLHIKPDENSGVQWFSVDDIKTPVFSAHDMYLYGKLARWARAQKGML